VLGCLFIILKRVEILPVLLAILGKRYKPTEVFQTVLEYRSYGW